MIRDQIRVNSAWVAIVCTLLGPIIAALIFMYSDVEKLKVTKAEDKEMMGIKLVFSEQMARNTVAIENLNDTLKRLQKGDKHEQYKESGD